MTLLLRFWSDKRRGISELSGNKVRKQEIFLQVSNPEAKIRGPQLATSTIAFKIKTMKV